MSFPTITSLNNDRVRRVQALLRSTRRRSREGLMVAEGLRLVEELAGSELDPTWLFFTEEFAAEERGERLVEALAERAGSVWRVTPEVLEALADTETPQGVVAVLPVPTLPAEFGPGLTLVFDNLRDPGNLGTGLRTAWGAGVRRVLLPPGNVDFTNPKVVRAGMGAHFHLPLRRLSWDGAQAALLGTEVWLAEAGDGGTPYYAVDWTGPTALIVGSEAHGAGPQARKLAGSRLVYIPMAEGVDSLNAAMATAVLLFEARRQREM